MRPIERRFIVGFFLVAWLLAGCASTSGLRRTALASESLAAGVERLQAHVETLHSVGAIGDGDKRAWDRAFERLAISGLALNEAIRKSDGQAATVQIRAIVDLVDDLLQHDVIRVPADQRVNVMLGLEAVRSVLLTLSVVVED